MALTRLAHQLIAEHFNTLNGDKRLAVDATCGNGYDTQFLLTLGFEKIHAFDIQPAALESTRRKNHDSKQLVLHLACHSQISLIISSTIDCAMFNLGYLPRQNKQITTLAPTSVAALTQVIEKLSTNGILTCLCYPGHPAGQIETESVRGLMQHLSQAYDVTQYDSRNPSESTPVLFIVKQKAVS